MRNGAACISYEMVPCESFDLELRRFEVLSFRGHVCMFTPACMQSTAQPTQLNSRALGARSRTPMCPPSVPPPRPAHPELTQDVGRTVLGTGAFEAAQRSGRVSMASHNPAQSEYSRSRKSNNHVPAMSARCSLHPPPPAHPLNFVIRSLVLRKCDGRVRHA
jgi:hypothetical protein